jgi:hypothetical protein
MNSGFFQADVWLAETSLVRVMRSSSVLCFCARIVQVRQPISHHDICNSAFILALTCSMTSAVTSASRLGHNGPNGESSDLFGRYPASNGHNTL